MTSPLGSRSACARCIETWRVCDPASVERWVIAHRARFQRLVFHNHCSQFVDVRAGVVAGPWLADTVQDGTPRPVCGMDTIAFRDGKITEY